MIPKLLIKFPSRGRPDRFFETLDACVNNMQDRENYLVSVTLDRDDVLMNTPEIEQRVLAYPNTEIGWGLSDSKIHAINRSMPDYDFDILLVMSDDMFFKFYGWDVIIRQAFEGNFDQYIHIPDNDAKDILATMYIAGKDFYRDRGYIYHPAYLSLFCDTELQEVAQKLGKYKYVPCNGLIFHANSAYGHTVKDEMFIRQQEIGWSIDHQTYNQRKTNNFYL